MGGASRERGRKKGKDVREREQGERKERNGQTKREGGQCSERGKQELKKREGMSMEQENEKIDVKKIRERGRRERRKGGNELGETMRAEWKGGDTSMRRTERGETEKEMEGRKVGKEAEKEDKKRK